ncbi:TPA: hypothetical protein NIF73_001746 [Pseudomonas aeruginosa]|nr:hypothetical protein [Pseudomonas aeruginosa]
MSSTQHQLIEQCATRLRGIVEALDNIHDNTPHRWSTDLDDVHSSAESLLALIKDQAPARSEASFEEWLANELEGEDGQPVPAAVCDIALARRAFNHWPKLEHPAKVCGVRFSAGVSSRLVVEAAQRLNEFESTPEQEAERPEVVAYRTIGRHTKHQHPHYALNYYKQNAEDQAAHWRERGCEVSEDELMTVAQHERIVGALRAENAKLSEALDRWPLIRDSLKLRLADALARVAELEGKLTDWVHEGFRLNEALAVAKAQHSVPEGWKLVPLEAPVEMLRAGSIALGMEPLSDGSDEVYPITGQQSTIRQCYAAMLAAAPGNSAQHSVPETTNKEANSFLRVADAGQFKDNAAAVRTAAMIIRGLLHGPAIMKSIIRHRICLTPEYEGQWHADLYGEAGEVQHHAEADTPDEAVRAVVALAAAPGKEVGHE